MTCNCTNDDGRMTQPSINLSKFIVIHKPESLDTLTSLQPMAFMLNPWNPRPFWHSLLTTNGSLDTAVGTHCGRLACWHYIHDLGPPLGKPDETYCEIQSDLPSGQKHAAQPTAAPDLLYVHQGVIRRQLSLNASVTGISATYATFNSSTLPAPLTISLPSSWFPSHAPTLTVIHSSTKSVA